MQMFGRRVFSFNLCLSCDTRLKNFINPRGELFCYSCFQFKKKEKNQNNSNTKYTYTKKLIKNKENLIMDR